MKIEISEELVERIQCLVDCGSYESTNHALEAAVHFLEEYEKEHEFELSIVRGMVQKAAEDVEKGNYRTYTDENLHEFFEDVIRRGRERALVQEGINALESGDFTTYTKENLHELFDEVKREGRLRRKRREERAKRLAKSKTVSD